MPPRTSVFTPRSPAVNLLFRAISCLDGPRIGYPWGSSIAIPWNDSSGDQHEMSRLSTTIIGLLALTTPAFAGTFYQATTSVETSQRGGDMRMVVKGWVDGDKARVEFQESDNPMAGTGTYLVTTDGAQTLFLVNPQEQTYMEWDMGALMGSVGAVLEGIGGLVQINFRDHEIQRLGQQPGPQIVGHSTTHYTYRTAYTTEIRVFRRPQETRTETQHEVWATTALRDPGFGAWLRTAPPSTGIEGLDEIIRNEMGTVEGFPLRSRAVTTSTDGRGRETISTTTMEVTELREESVDPAMFVIPDGFRRVEMPTLPFGGQ
jgi:hypothetical protein